MSEKHGKDQRERRQRLLAAREQREHLRPLPRRMGEDLEAGLQRVVGFDQLKLGAAAAEQGGEQGSGNSCSPCQRRPKPLAARG